MDESQPDLSAAIRQARKLRAEVETAFQKLDEQLRLLRAKLAALPDDGDSTDTPAGHIPPVVNHQS